MSLSPHAAPALSDDNVAPVRELSLRGSHSGGDETPFQRLACYWAFPMKIVLFRYDAEIIITLSLW